MVQEELRWPKEVTLIEHSVKQIFVVVGPLGSVISVGYVLERKEYREKRR
jgi:hypothetical protein